MYLNPLEHALVLSLDEKSQIQALDRTQPGLPLKKGRAGTMTHDYKRHRTTTLFAALSMLDGKVIGECMKRHRHQESPRFLRRADRDTPAELGRTGRALHPITVCHYPPGASKWNTMAHRMFSFMSLDWQGQPLVSYETIVNLISRTTTRTGLKIAARLDTRQ